MSPVQLLSVDLQHEFALPGGRLFHPRGCVSFLTDLLFPTAAAHGWPVHEIVADYRDPEKPSDEWSCAPGSWAATSLVPRTLLVGEPWVKSTPSPAWTRSGGGDASATPGPARRDPDAFAAWCTRTVGPPDPDRAVVVVGLMLEVCVLSTLQELHYLGYKPKVLFEGVDTHSGDLAQKQVLFDTLLPFWGTPLRWENLPRG